MRRVVLVLAVGALVGVTPAWGAEITLRADHRIARYDDRVRFRGTLPTPEPQQVLLVRDGAVVASATASGGGFVFDLRARRAGVFVARTALSASPGVTLLVKPRLRIRVVGKRRFGRTVRVVGRLLPSSAGQLRLESFRGASIRIRMRPGGRFRVRIPTRWGPNITGRISIVPRPRYLAAWRRIHLRLGYPSLRTGSHGPAVLALKRRLAELRFALPSVDSGFGHATYQAVLAFQKVHRLPRTGRVGPGLWRRLWRSSIPRPRVRRGDYIEVDKSRQVLMEVRDGKVTNVVHVSTGETGNTPVGTWRVYREVYGWDWILYHPMYFLRGFAIHGYPSVPMWPASHGCVRVPLWMASALRERWGRGSVIRVYA
jgi:N-acetylmuramoyl-L-alanine amidase